MRRQTLKNNRTTTAAITPPILVAEKNELEPLFELVLDDFELPIEDSVVPLDPSKTTESM